MAEFSKHFNIKKHSINPVFDKQPSYKLIYGLNLIEIETFKLILRPTWLAALFVFSDFLLVHLSFLCKNPIVVLAYMIIIDISII